MKVPNYIPIVNVAVGILTILTPYVNGSTAQELNMTITGLVLVAVGVAAMMNYVSGGTSYLSAINIVAGAWLLVSIRQESDAVMVWSNIVLGTTAIVTALASMAYARFTQTEHTDARVINFVPLINIAVGILTIAAPFANHSSALETNLAATGAVLIAVGILAFAMQALRVQANYFSGVNVLIGFWLLVALGWEANAPALLWTTTLLAIVCIMTGFVALPYEHANNAFAKNAP